MQRGYDDGIVRLLGLLPRTDTAEHAVPTIKIKVVAGVQNLTVAIRYSKHGRHGIVI